jgi:hypothetical protein
MRRFLQFTALCLTVTAMNACRPEEVVETEDIPTAGVRFIHAVPDTGAMDFRAVDLVENNASYNTTFRSTTQLFYKNARAGSRHFRVFRSDTLAAVASIVVKDTTVTLEAGHRYTFILWGFSRPGSSPAMKLDIIDDNPADPGAQVALRIVNAAAGLGAIDGKQYLATATPPGTPTWANVAALTASAYVSTPTGSIRYNVTPAGGGTALFADATALAGVPATIDIDAIPGTTVAGSAVSGFVFPRAVLGSQATQSFTTPGILFLWDRRPPRPAGL